MGSLMKLCHLQWYSYSLPNQLVKSMGWGWGAGWGGTAVGQRFGNTLLACVAECLTFQLMALLVNGLGLWGSR